MDDISDQILVLLRIFDSIRIEDRIAGSVQRHLHVHRLAKHRPRHAGRADLDPTRRADELQLGSLPPAVGGQRGPCIRGHERVPPGLRTIRGCPSPLTTTPKPRRPSTSSSRRGSAPGCRSSSTATSRSTQLARASMPGPWKPTKLIMDALADLVIEAVDHLTEAHEDLDLLALAELVATSPTPETPLAKHFHSRVLAASITSHGSPARPDHRDASPRSPSSRATGTSPQHCLLPSRSTTCAHDPAARSPTPTSGSRSTDSSKNGARMRNSCGKHFTRYCDRERPRRGLRMPSPTDTSCRCSTSSTPSSGWTRSGAANSSETWSGTTMPV